MDKTVGLCFRGQRGRSCGCKLPILFVSDCIDADTVHQRQERRQCLTYADLPLADQLVEICGLKPSSIINIIYGKAWRSFTATFPASFQFPAAAFSGGFLPVNLTPDRVPLPLALHEMGNLRASGSRGAANKVAKVDDSPAELNEKGQSFVNKFRFVTLLIPSRLRLYIQLKRDLMTPTVE